MGKSTARGKPFLVPCWGVSFAVKNECHDEEYRYGSPFVGTRALYCEDFFPVVAHIHRSFYNRFIDSD